MNRVHFSPVLQFFRQAVLNIDTTTLLLDFESRKPGVERPSELQGGQASSNIRSFTSQNPTIATTSSLLVNTVSYHSHQKYPSSQAILIIRQEKDIEAAYILTQQFIAMAHNGQGSLFDAWLQSCLSSGIPDMQIFAEGLQEGFKRFMLLYER